MVVPSSSLFVLLTVPAFYREQQKTFHCKKGIDTPIYLFLEVKNGKNSETALLDRLNSQI
jgi:hypothetical protein